MADWPKLAVKGGPHGHSVEATIDGEPIPKVSRMTIVMDPRDAIRVRFEQIVEIEVDVEMLRNPGGTVASHVVVSEIPMDVPEGALKISGWKIAESTADTTWQALYDCARQLELEAKKEAQTVEQ